jgi:bifunctional DNA-binding transcriptional regulator/antitoxin component of YhaV-PrlF toxin-antitoxin module
MEEERLTSITSRGLVYIPEEYQRRLKIKKPTNLKIYIVGKKIIIEPTKSATSLAGSLKKYTNKKIPENYRELMEKNYEKA